MTDTMIAAPLAAALAAKGYESLTPVQQAVIAPELAGRDALVSAQTGSGKTVAFGLAMAGEVLAGADRLLFAHRPLALIIAPTRELAQQVAAELTWLYAEAGAQIATCVGGMDYRNERRALERGAHIVVGTPGRLRDHIERGSLDLSGTRATVLDEADEMLDLGFAEDLEFILSAAPEDRRTLMFSATVPKEIEKLASTFQRDAVRVQTAGEARQHGDIEYRAFNVSARDKEHAIFNILRFYEARTAIVFCKTRLNVNHLLARMGNRGFQVVALSGELSQTERMHALQALRDGRARVCIATDVAARGIDLPGLELVIHADLPSNSETLLHRSGRTGRAGRKGVSALVVPPAEFRKAQRLLQGAKVVADWVKAPSADEVQDRDDARLMDLPLLSEALADETAMAQALVARYGADHMAAAFVRLWRQGRSAPEVLQDSLPTPQAGAAAPAPRDRNAFGEAEWYSINVGHTKRAEARWLLPKICDAAGITKTEIGAIRVQQENTFVQIARAVAGKLGSQLVLEEGVEMIHLDGEPNLARPERAPYERKSAPRGDKPAYTPKPSRFVDDEPAAPRAPRAEAPAGREDRKTPYMKRETTERRSASEGAETERKAWKPRSLTADAPRKPYARDDDGPRKPYARREDSDAPRKPYVRRDEADSSAPRKPYRAAEGDAPRKPYVKRDATGDDQGKRPYAPRSAAPADNTDRKPRWKLGEDRPAKPEGKFAPRSTGFKSHGTGKDAAGNARPGRATGFKSHGSEGKTFGKPARAKPAAAPVNARDTSKRFVPPKKK